MKGGTLGILDHDDTSLSPEASKIRGYWVSTSELKESVCRLERCGRWKDARPNFHWR